MYSYNLNMYKYILATNKCIPNLNVKLLQVLSDTVSDGM